MMRHRWLSLLLVAACNGTGSGVDAAAMDGQVFEDAGALESGVPVDAAAATPSISSVLECGRNGAGGVSAGRDASRLQRHALDLEVFPEARCNDGTGGVFFFRPSEGEAGRHRWVIQLQGGGGCSSAQACANRWCSVETNFGMNKMTSEGAPAMGIDGRGILSRRSENPYGDWNQVFIYYCSSDGWAGGGAVRDVDAEHPTRGTPVRLRLHFSGHRIVEAVVGSLRREAGAIRWEDGGEGIELDDLDDAVEVALVGASAGGGGVINNLDWLRDELAPVAVEGLVDSSFSPAFESLDFSATAFCLEDELCDYDAFMSQQVALRSALHDPWADASCLSMHVDDPFRCGDTGHVVRHHLTTPFFVRMGLVDSLVSSNFIEASFGLPEEGALTLASFAREVREQLDALATLPATAEEGAAMAVAPGAFGIACPKHETLRSEPDTYDARLRNADIDHAFPTVLAAWREGRSPTNLTTDTPMMDRCP